ncbi:pyridoxamine 5'-phosphate oxidase family protein [Nocardioides yefusunii]|uniref:Pyridoxamine 5'-phosphate oxidase family protein n=1 Tax=Nocardioides yefusunii TaxID=2500546 RepID=A0ABW1R154_9ACTN|nr:pyridoxamine 5'-phosphate oxidase family protein [Nocardioides yefusunii]
MSVFRPGWDAIPHKIVEFYDEYQINTLTTIRPNGRPHVVPVGLTLDVENECAWIITRDGSRKVANIREAALSDDGARVALCQVDGPRWSTIEGTAKVVTDEAQVNRAIELYTARYKRPAENGTSRVAIRIEVDRIVHSPMLLDNPPAFAH